jgi:hypothetical protein
MSKEQMVENEQQILVDVEIIAKERAKVQTNADLRTYYQHLLLKLVRDIDLFQDKPQSLDQFVKISEFQESIKDQEYYQHILTEIDIDQELIDFANRQVGSQQHLAMLNSKLDELGLNKDIDQLDELRSS